MHFKLHVFLKLCLKFRFSMKVNANLYDFLPSEEPKKKPFSRRVYTMNCEVLYWTTMEPLHSTKASVYYLKFYFGNQNGSSEASQQKFSFGSFIYKST